MSFHRVLKQFAVKSGANVLGMQAHIIPFRGAQARSYFVCGQGQ